MIKPIDGRLVQNFYTPVSYMADRKTHQADDWVTDGYKPIYAPAEARVTQVIDGYNELWISALASRQNRGFGNHVEIKFSDGAIMTASHLRKGIPVKVGDTVPRGTIIGYSGRTGYRVPLSVYHTHIEILIGGARVDPQKYTAPEPAPAPQPPQNNQSTNHLLKNMNTPLFNVNFYKRNEKGDNTWYEMVYIKDGDDPSAEYFIRRNKPTGTLQTLIPIKKEDLVETAANFRVGGLEYKVPSRVKITQDEANGLTKSEDFWSWSAILVKYPNYLA